MPDICAACGGTAPTQRIAPFSFVHGGKHCVVQDQQTVCETCGTVSYVGEQISRHELAVSGRIREMDGLLSADELRNIRLKYALRQTDMEAMLSIGPKTWTRWERGKIPQSKAADTLIRVLAVDPEVARRLMRQAKIDNPDAEAVLAAIDQDTQQRAEANLRTQIGMVSSAIDVGDIARQAIAAVRDVRREWSVRAA